MSDFYRDLMIEAGLTILDNENGMVIGSAGGLRYRALDWGEHHELHIAVEKTFDRWANSTDFIAPLPSTVEHLKQMIATAQRVAKDTDTAGFGKRAALPVAERDHEEKP